MRAVQHNVHAPPLPHRPAGNAEDIERFSKRTVRMERYHITDCMKLLALMGMPVLEAPCEVRNDGWDQRVHACHRHRRCCTPVPDGVSITWDEVSRHHARHLYLPHPPSHASATKAEAQCAVLAKAGKVYAAASEDMDTLTFGAPRLVRQNEAGVRAGLEPLFAAV